MIKCYERIDPNNPIELKAKENHEKYIYYYFRSLDYFLALLLDIENLQFYIDGISMEEIKNS